MKGLSLYIIGYAVSFIIAFMTEWLYYGSGRISTVKRKDIVEDALYSLLSWIGVVGEIVFYIGELFCGCTEYGYGEFLENYEKSLKEKAL